MDPVIPAAPDLRIDLGPLSLANPVMTASGTFGYGAEFSSLVDLHRLGAIVVKGISLAPRAGNPPPRIVETACGMLNAIGLENVGLERFPATRCPGCEPCAAQLLSTSLGIPSRNMPNWPVPCPLPRGSAASR